MCQGPLISEVTLIITADKTLCTTYFTHRLTSHHCIANAPYKPVCRLRSPKLGTGTKIAPDSTKLQLPSCKFFWLPKVLHHPHAPFTSTQLSPTSFYFAWSNEDVQNFYKWKLEKWNVQKLDKWKVSVCNNKSIQGQIYDWTMCCFLAFFTEHTHSKPLTTHGETLFFYFQK